MNESTIIPIKDSPNQQIIVPHFKSLWLETYFFQEIIRHLQIDNCQSDTLYTFTLSSEFFPALSSLSRFFKESRYENWMMIVYELHDTELIPNLTSMFREIQATVPKSGDPQKAHFTLKIEGKVFEYLKKVNEVGSIIDSRVQESIKSKYANCFYRFLQLLKVSQITEFSCEFKHISSLFQVKQWRLDQWKRNGNNFLEEILEEITNHPTHPIAFEYSTNEYFDKSLPEDRRSKYLYFRVLAEPIFKTPFVPLISMKPIYRLIANLKNQSQQGILYLFVAFIGLMLGNASALVDTIAESLMIIPCITIYLLACVRLIYRHLHPSQR